MHTSTISKKNVNKKARNFFLFYFLFVYTLDVHFQQNHTSLIRYIIVSIIEKTLMDLGSFNCTEVPQNLILKNSYIVHYYIITSFYSYESIIINVHQYQKSLLTIKSSLNNRALICMSYWYLNKSKKLLEGLYYDILFKFKILK